MKFVEGVRAKKSLIGYKENSEGDFLLLSVAEQDNNMTIVNGLVKKIDALNASIDNLKRGHALELRDKDVLIKKLRVDVNDLENHVKGLKRICTERANADRDIRPKKKKSGYVLLRQQQRKVMKRVIWVARYQTPYLTSLDASSLRAMLKDDLQGNVFNRAMFVQGNGKYWEFDIESDRPFK